MAEPKLSSVGGLDVDDDLPRALRRERDAQARRARDLEFNDAASDDAASASTPESIASPFQSQAYEYDDADPAPATVTRLDIPFLHMMLFFLKAVVAAVPALMLLLVILWGVGELLTATFPELIKMQVLIRMPN